jgi:peptidoglycan-associated lipoprotein
LKKFIFVVILFLCAGCRNHPGGNPMIDPQNNLKGLEADNRDSGQEPIPLDDQDLNAGRSHSTVLNPVFFPFDEFRIEEDQVPVLQTNADTMSHSLAANFTVEGHCDERGTEEYNLALGDRRAKAAKDYLVSLGIDPKRIHTISYGENHPFGFGHDETAWRLNRRAQFLAEWKEDQKAQ